MLRRILESLFRLGCSLFLQKITHRHTRMCHCSCFDDLLPSTVTSFLTSFLVIKTGSILSTQKQYYIAWYGIVWHIQERKMPELYPWLEVLRELFSEVLRNACCFIFCQGGEHWCSLLCSDAEKELWQAPSERACLQHDKAQPHTVRLTLERTAKISWGVPPPHCWWLWEITWDVSIIRMVTESTKPRTSSCKVFKWICGSFWRSCRQVTAVTESICFLPSTFVSVYSKYVHDFWYDLHNCMLSHSFDMNCDTALLIANCHK